MDFKKHIGEKLKKRRIELGMTQKEVCSDFMTRNMLSLIESGAAQPSIDTLIFIAQKLDISLPSLFADETAAFAYEKSLKIEEIQKKFSTGNYPECIKLIDSLSGNDSELNYLYAYAAFMYGKKLLNDGSFSSASRYLNIALKKSAQTVYNTIEIEVVTPLYLAVAENVLSPLLEFDSETYLNEYDFAYDREFFKYVTLDVEFEFKNQLFSKHMEAKKLIRRYNYRDAIVILRELEENKTENYNAYAMFGVYTDLENAYKQIGDFENAYRYSSKRMTLLNAFKD